MIAIEKGTIKEVYELMDAVPEFTLQQTLADYEERCQQGQLALVARIEGKAAGFKLAYDRLGDGSLYSWIGAVLPEFRRMGVAQALADSQEEWAREQGYTSIVFKTRNCFPAMIHFAIANGFKIIDIDKREEPDEHRIWLKKSL
ncbi:GNAT family N-acetyltransferase [Chitinophagales bacterium]|nr:GNAT family N-acetyltransferase [Chitinophagales bacterium]